MRSLVGQQQQTPAAHPDGLVRDFSDHSFQTSPTASPQSVPTAPLASVDEDTLVPAQRHASIPRSRDRADSPAPSEPGSLRLHSHGSGASYVGSVHWAAVLESISELRDHYEEEEEARMLATSDHALLQSPGPRLLYEPVQATKAHLLASIPARPVVDRMVARYFNAQGVVPGILHSGHFLREVRCLLRAGVQCQLPMYISFPVPSLPPLSLPPASACSLNSPRWLTVWTTFL